MAADLHIFGVRHHGPGSARRVLSALEALRPALVLIEGPSDASDLLPLLARPDARPPLALLVYAEGAPQRASFYPFAEYSPEYQAALWAAREGVEARFMDLPAAIHLAMEDAEGDEDAADIIEGDNDERTPENPVARDPIGALARAAGYEDGESWWRDVIEEAPGTGEAFAAVTGAMAALRAEAGPDNLREQRREAQMRLEIGKALKDAGDRPVAVVCGAWHAPALTDRPPAQQDRALLKGLPKAKTRATLAPWTAPRLTRETGYGAGVPAPGWCAHVWRSGEAHGSDHANAVWLGRISAALREAGHLVSTASVIEAVRLGVSLAALRGRPAPGFEELREAAIACLCFGNEILWREVERSVLIGAEVGAIPADAPLAPLLVDLERQQKKARLKPEARARELSLDLRSDSGLFRSTLLHRLQALGVDWGRLIDAGKSRGTFRERWRLEWRPELAVSLVEHLVFGPTIDQAAGARLVEQMRATPGLAALAGLVRDALTAQLPAAAHEGVAALEKLAAQTSDCLALLQTLPPLAEIARYGQARAVEAEALAGLTRRTAIQAAITLPQAARGLDAQAADEMRKAVLDAHRAIALAELSEDEQSVWAEALETVARDAAAAPLLSGAAARLLYEAEGLTAAEIGDLLARALSPGRPVSDSAAYFEGFFSGAGARLIHDAALRAAADTWLCGLDAEAFTASLPLLRRVFSGLDATERRRLLDAALSRGGRSARHRLAPGADALWAARLPELQRILIEGRP